MGHIATRDYINALPDNINFGKYLNEYSFKEVVKISSISGKIHMVPIYYLLRIAVNSGPTNAKVNEFLSKRVIQENIWQMLSVNAQQINIDNFSENLSCKIDQLTITLHIYLGNW